MAVDYQFKMHKGANIILYGCGNIGFYHFVGLLNVEKKLNIYLFDKKSIYKKKFTKYFEDNNEKKNKKIYFLESLNIIPSIDLVIMSTTSKNRSKAIIDLLNKYYVRYFLIEKVPFQKKNDYLKIIKIFKRNNVKGWVNCTRRSWIGYQILKKKYLTKYNNLTVKGSNWNLTSNSIHFMDLFEFINDNENMDLQSASIKNTIFTTKRKEFLNLKGKLIFKNSFNNYLIIEETIKDTEFIIKIENEKYIIMIDQNKQICKIFSKNRKKNIKKIIFNNEFQSSLTTKYVNTFINNKKINLLDFETSFLLNIKLIELFNKKFSNLLKKKTIACPIT